jgi:cytochrome oxidase assembly protein ShyY1
VLEVLRQRRWLGFSLFVMAMLALCVVLADWQWSRYQQRTAENEALDRALSAPTASIDELLVARPAGSTDSTNGLPAGLEWRMVTATGQFNPDAEAAVRRRPLDGRTGFWIVTPLVTESGVVLVNRGWAPAGQDATAPPDVPAAPAGTVTVTGRLRAPEATLQTEPPPAGQAWAADPDALLAPDAGDRYDAYVQLRDSDPDAAEGLTALSDPGHRGLNNLVYSVQWLIFAAVAAVGWWRLIRQESRRETEGDDTEGVDAAGDDSAGDDSAGDDSARDDTDRKQDAAAGELSPGTRPAG